MGASATNHILVDASIAKSATDPARHPVSMAALAFVKLVQDRSCATGAALTPILLEEWRRHASRFMTSWLADMEQRNRVRHLADKRMSDFRRAVAAVPDAGIRDALVKDAHLSEAAMFYGLPVASRDSRQRKYLAMLSSTYPLAGSVQWLDPEDEAELWQEWLRTGCVDRSAFACEPPA